MKTMYTQRLVTPYRRILLGLSFYRRLQTAIDGVNNGTKNKTGEHVIKVD